MKITQLDIQGFRSLKNVSWKPGDLNVLIGPNGSGKSNLLRALEMISASANGELGRYVLAAGGMGSLVWDGHADRIRIAVDTSPLGGAVLDMGLRYEVEMARLGASSLYRIEHEVLRNKEDAAIHLERVGDSASVYFEGDGVYKRSGKGIQEDETILSLSRGPFTQNKSLPDFQEQLAGWSIFPDFRVDQSAPVRQPAVSRLENKVSPDGQNLINVLHTLYSGDREFKRQVNSAMRAAFGDDFEELVFAPDAGDQRVQLRVRWKTLKRDQSAADLSDGTLRFLFLLAVLASPNPASLIAIDEPETGLHPSMLPLVADFAVDAALRTQVILTTHSDQFLDAFGDTRPTTTVAKWHEGETTLTTLDSQELEYWLKDYSLGTLYRTGEMEALA